MLLVIREMQIQPAMRYRFTSVRMATMKKKTRNNKCCHECGEHWNLVETYNDMFAVESRMTAFSQNRATI